MRARERAIIATMSYAYATSVGGWWTLPLVAVAWGWLDRGAERPAASAALGAALGWTFLLSVRAIHGPLLSFAAILGGVLHLPGWGALLLTVAFAAALAAAGAGLAHQLRFATARPERTRGRPPR